MTSAAVWPRLSAALAMRSSTKGVPTRPGQMAPEYADLLVRAGWRPAGSYHAPGSIMGVIEGVCG